MAERKKATWTRTVGVNHMPNISNQSLGAVQSEPSRRSGQCSGQRPARDSHKQREQNYRILRITWQSPTDMIHNTQRISTLYTPHAIYDLSIQIQGPPAALVPGFFRRSPDTAAGKADRCREPWSSGTRQLHGEIEFQCFRNCIAPCPSFLFSPRISLADHPQKQQQQQQHHDQGPLHVWKNSELGCHHRVGHVMAGVGSCFHRAVKSLNREGP